MSLDATHVMWREGRQQRGQGMADYIDRHDVHWNIHPSALSQRAHAEGSPPGSPIQRVVTPGSIILLAANVDIFLTSRIL